MLKSPDFQTSATVESMDIIRLKVRDLGLSGTSTTDQIYRRAQDLGLELCPAELGPHYRLKYQNQPLGEWFSIAMKQITDRYGYPSVFDLERNGGGLWLDGDWAGPADEWSPDDGLAFRLRKKES